MSVIEEVVVPGAGDVPNVAEALETNERVASHLHPQGSSRVEDHPVPNGREEVWRFTPLKRMRGLHADAPFTADGVDYSWTAQAGVEIARVDGDRLASWRGLSGYVPGDRTSARILSEVGSTLTVDIAPEAEIAEPIVLRMTGHDTAAVAGGHLAVRFGHHAKATVLLVHEGSATIAQVVEVQVADGAQATVATVQDWADDTVHLVQHAAHVGANASLKHVCVTFGGDLVRLNASVDYVGAGGSAQLLGMYFADAEQHLEHRLFVDHNAPHTISNVDYRGALQGQGAHSVWVGDVLIRKVAEGIETYESNKNLILTDGCRADSVPNLEIETGEIAGAGHASTTGRFDDEQLFYLRSRGITEAEARRLVVHGFFADIIRRIGVADVERQLLQTLEAELSVTVGADGTALGATAHDQTPTLPSAGGTTPLDPRNGSRVTEPAEQTP